MASWEEGSFDPDFVDSKASKEFTCSICLSLAIQPRLNPSCGHHYCRPCTEKLVGKGQPCPECRADITNPVPDLYFERQMKQLKVRCLGSKNGCRWIGKLGELQNHHECCSLILVKCEFSCVGCTARVVRGVSKKHMQDSLSVHLGLLCKKVQQKDNEIADLWKTVNTVQKELQLAEEKIERLEQQLASPSAVATPVFVMTRFEEHKDKKETWHSPPFYSHTGGYKMRLKVDAAGYGVGAGTHVSVLVLMMQGENDDHLKWPFRGCITVELINHRALGGNANIEHKILSTNDTPDAFACRVIGRRMSAQGLGIHKFIAHSDLPYNSVKNTEYLNNDSLTFCVTKVSIC